MSYSIDTMKKSAFQDELINVLKTIPNNKVDPNIVAVIEYFQRRIKEIDRKYK
jgi:hypothetical protein